MVSHFIRVCFFHALRVEPGGYDVSGNLGGYVRFHLIRFPAFLRNARNHLPLIGEGLGDSLRVGRSRYKSHNTKALAKGRNSTTYRKHNTTTYYALRKTSMRLYAKPQHPTHPLQKPQHKNPCAQKHKGF